MWRDGGAPVVTVRLAEVVVSKNAVMVTDVLFPTANVVTVKLADVWPPGTLTMPGTLGNGRITRSERNRDAAGRRRSAQEYSSGGVCAAADASRS